MGNLLFADVAQQLYDNGYDIMPINGKRPMLDDWQSIEITSKRVRRWVEKYGRRNVGIRTEFTPAIDLDVYDAEVAELLESWCLESLSEDAPVRIGAFPKRLLVFRTEQPFRKMKESYYDSDGQRHQIEILGHGQQFAAFGVHPDTGKPFSWVSIESPLDIAHDNLPTLTVDDAKRLFAYFAELAEERGWTRKGSKALVAQSGEALDDDDALMGVASKADDLDDEDIRDALSLIDVIECDYDRWLTVGMALHHQYDGADTGLELWDEWSADSPDYDYDEIKEKWASFSVARSGGKPTTVATILKWAKEGARAKTKDDFERATSLIANCNDVEELFDDIARKVAKLAVLPHHVEIAASKLQQRMLDLSGVRPPIRDMRKLLTGKRTPAEPSDAEQPNWVSDFVWLENEDRFYCLSERKGMTIRTYNARHDRHMLTPEEKAMGVAVPATRAADAAFTRYGIRHVDGMIYLPGAEQIVKLNESEVRVNIYDDRDVPEMVEPKSKEQRRALRAVQYHFEMLFPDERERNLAISYLAYQVQCPSERINWALLVQGVEGAGKTWIQNLMAGVLGPKNVGPVNPSSLFAPFNGWAEGRKMIFVEEIRLRGHDRFEVLDKIKTNITNDTLEITRKGRDPYVTPNVASYVMFTNYQDALSLTDNDRRYMILMTSLQSARDIAVLLRDRPDHFADIFNAVAEHPGVMRWWLMNFQLSDEFDPKGKAPTTEAKRLMRDLNRSDEQDAIEDLLRDAPHVDCNEYLLNVTRLPGWLTDMEGEFVVPRTAALKAMLEQMGFKFLGRFKVDGSPQRYYTRRPDLFLGNGAEIAAKVRMILDGHEPEFV